MLTIWTDVVSWSSLCYIVIISTIIHNIWRGGLSHRGGGARRHSGTHQTRRRQLLGRGFQSVVFILSIGCLSASTAQRSQVDGCSKTPIRGGRPRKLQKANTGTWLLPNAKQSYKHASTHQGPKPTISHQIERQALGMEPILRLA